MAPRKDVTLARIAVQLAREDAGRYMTVAEIVDRAAKLAGAAYAARSAVERGKPPERHYEAARLVAAEFGAIIVPRGDVHGCVVGVRFTSGRHRAGFEDLFYVT